MAFGIVEVSILKIQLLGLNKIMKLKNIFAALKDQGPFIRFAQNVWKGHVFGLFHKRSHTNESGKLKVMYNTKASAAKAAMSMGKKRGAYFSNYKCMFCDGYHIGKNRDNKIAPPINTKLNVLFTKAYESAQHREL